MAFSPCPECSRHVRQLEPACPFCGSAATRPEPKRPRRSTRRVTRAALFFAGLLGACGGAEDEPASADIYGGPPISQGEDEPEDDPVSDEEDGEEDPTEAMPVEAYGAPAPPPDDGP